MRMPSSSSCRLDLVPPLADRFILESPPRLRPGTSPQALRIPSPDWIPPRDGHPALRSTAEWWLQVRLGLYPAFAFVPVLTSPYLPLSPASEAINPRFWIWRSSFERQRDFNPPEQRAAQHTQRKYPPEETAPPSAPPGVSPWLLKTPSDFKIKEIRYDCLTLPSTPVA